MSFADTINAQASRPEPKRDRWGRYLLPVPGKAKPQGHTRVTTLVKAIDDTSNLEKWACRMTAVGIAQSPDLQALVASHTDDRDALNRAVDEAKDRARTGAAANTGTALHKFCEMADAGLPVPPGEWEPDVAAYRSTLDACGVEVLVDYMESIVRVGELGAAGTFDRLVRIGGRTYVADIKTGSIDYGHTTIPAQLACYAHGDLWNGEDDPATAYTSLAEMGVDQELGLIIHLPAGTGTCRLVWADLVAGWEIAKLCHTVREWRKRKDTFSDFDTPTANPDQDDAGLQLRTAWIRGRVEALSPAGREHLLLVWPDGVTKGANLERTHAELDLLATALDQAEAAVEAPFGPPDPTVATPEPRPRLTPVAVEAQPTQDLDDRELTADEADEIIKRVKACPDPAQLRTWAAEAAAAGLVFGIAAERTLHHGHRLSAALMCAPQGDELTRTLIHAITGEEPQPVETTGALLATLGARDAHRLHQVAKAIAEGALSLTFADDGTPVVAHLAA